MFLVRPVAGFCSDKMLLHLCSSFIHSTCINGALAVGCPGAGGAVGYSSEQSRPKFFIS
jgi:hypothetical protein